MQSTTETSYMTVYGCQDIKVYFESRKEQKKDSLKHRKNCLCVGVQVFPYGEK